MKLVYFLILLATYQAHSLMLIVEETVEDKCIRTLGLNETEIQITIRESHTPEDNEHYGWFYVCMWRERGVMNEDGDIVTGGIGRFLREVILNPSIPVGAQNTIVRKINELCAKERGESREQTAVKLKNCVVQSLKEIYNYFLHGNKHGL